MIIIALVLSPFIILGAIAIYAEQQAKRRLRERRKLFQRSAELNASLRIVYIDAHGQQTERVIDPVLADDHQLEAWCHLRRAKRHFRYDRMQSIEVVGESIRSRR